MQTTLHPSRLVCSSLAQPALLDTKNPKHVCVIHRATYRMCGWHSVNPTQGSVSVFMAAYHTSIIPGSLPRPRRLPTRLKRWHGAQQGRNVWATLRFDRRSALSRPREAGMARLMRAASFDRLGPIWSWRYVGQGRKCLSIPALQLPVVQQPCDHSWHLLTLVSGEIPTWRPRPRVSTAERRRPVPWG